MVQSGEFLISAWLRIIVLLIPSLVPDVTRAKLMYRADGGSLSSPGIFGCNPLASNARKCDSRSEAFMLSFSFETIFSDIVNGDEQSFKDAFKFFVDVTYRLLSSDEVKYIVEKVIIQKSDAKQTTRPYTSSA